MSSRYLADAQHWTEVYEELFGFKQALLSTLNEQRRRDATGKVRRRERLGAVGELVEHDPATQDGADDAHEEELEQRPLHERVRPGLDDGVHQ